MAIKRISSEKDNVITNAYKFDLQNRATDSNMGQSDVLEVFSIFGQQSKNSIEKTRILLQFPVSEVVSQRSAGNIPKSGSVNFVLRMFNAEHNQSVPRNFYLNVLPVAQSWDEGYGLDMETYVDTGASNWVSASDASNVQITKYTFLSSSANDYSGASVSLYEPDGDRHNFWFKHQSTSTAPSLDGTEHEVDIIGKSTPTEVASAFRNFVNPVAGFSAVSQEGNGAVVIVSNMTPGAVSAQSFNSLPSNTINVEVTQQGKSATLWSTEGGSTWDSSVVRDNGLMSYQQKFSTGMEDLEVDITGLVEEWVKGETGSGLIKASGSITFDANSRPVDNSTITLTSTDGLKREYRFMSSGITNAATGSSDSSVIFVDSSSKAIGTITTTGSPGNNEEFTLVDADGTSVTYIFKTDSTTVDGTKTGGKVIIGISGASGHAPSVGDRIRAAITASDLNVAAAETTGGSMTLTQNTKGVSGLTNIDMSGVATTDGTNFVDNTETIANNFVAAVKSANAHGDRFSISADTVGVSLTQSVAGFGGNAKITPTGEVNATLHTYLSGGTGAINNGSMVLLQGAYEDGTTGTSFYTKKFFARGSEFMLKRPVLEARWDSSVTDDRNDFYLSSSMLSSADNLNSLYLYNYFRGSLNNLPNVATGNLYVKFLNKSGTEITTSTPRNPITASYSSTGVYRAQVALTTAESSVTDVWFYEQAASGSITTTGNPGNNQTFALSNSAGTVSSFVFKTDSTTVDGTKDGDNIIIGLQGATGNAAAVGDRIRSAIGNSGLNITATETAAGSMTLTQNVKGSAGNTTINMASVDTVDATSFSGGIGPIEFHRGTLSPKTHSSKAYRPNFNYVSKLLNLKPSYNTQEKPRIRLFVRERDWCPNVYSVASNKIETSVIKQSYYKLSRVSDDFSVINYGTGSVEYTKMSYDVSGSYFDLDMSIMEPGYAYEISIVYKLDNDYKEQNDTFRFRVEK